MHYFRTDVHNLIGSATQSDSTDPLGVYNTYLRQLLDRHAPLVTRTVTDRRSAPWMTLEIKQAKVQRRLAERKCRESGLAVHREIYVKQRNLVSDMISKAKKDYLCDKIVNCGSSRELFRLSSQMMSKFGNTLPPSNISPESLPDKFNEFFVHKTDEIRRSFDPDRPIPTHFTYFTYPIVYLTVGAPRMIGQPLFSILLCFRPFEELHPTLILSTPLCCLPISFSVCLSFSLLVQCPVGSSLQVLLILFCAHTISVFVSSQW